MNKQLPLFLSIFLFATVVQGQKVQWAYKVIDFSSQYGVKQYSAKQALGKPNVLPAAKDSPCAWSPRQEQSRTDEYLVLGFQNPMAIQQVVVAESHNPGSVSRVLLYDTKGQVHEVYRNDMTMPLREPGRMLRVTFPMTTYKVSAVKVVLNTLGLKGWNHIDAIGISPSSSPVKASINLVKDMKFESKPENLGVGVNSRFDEIMPIISPDGKTLYFDRKDHPDNSGGIINDDIWMSTMAPGGIWTRSRNVSSPLNNSGHNFLTAISPDGNTALLGNVYESDGTMSSGLSISSRVETGWRFPRKLVIRNYYNNNKYSEFHMGADGKTIVMTVERNDSYGSKDLYVSFLLSDGTWSQPKNLGARVNSAATEMSPFLAADGKTLYFSSDGFSGFGSKDMYMTRRLDDSWKRWSEPQNLGPMINSASWDAYYSIPASGEFAYFSSENNSIGKTDIFRIKLPRDLRPEPVVLVRGKVLDEKTRKPIQAKIIYETLKNGKEVGVAVSSPKTGEYTIVLPAGEKYGFRAEAEDYISLEENLDLTKITEYKELNKDLFLNKLEVNKPYVLNNIFFPPSRATLNVESYPELNRLAKFLKENSKVKIEIGGHTNNSCTESFCLKLSRDRAKSVFYYLTKKGILASRMTYVGYGSKRPKCSNATPEGKRCNRRVEFTILAM